MHTVWKFEHFSATQILSEINFGEEETSCNGSNFGIRQNIQDMQLLMHLILHSVEITKIYYHACLTKIS